jgi:hypothetical protein
MACRTRTAGSAECGNSPQSEVLAKEEWIFQFRCGLGVYDANTNSRLEPCFPTLLKEDFMSDVAKNIVLVHGAFADGSSWSKVIPLLQEKGYHAVAV